MFDTRAVDLILNNNNNRDTMQKQEHSSFSLNMSFSFHGELMKKFHRSASID